MKKHVILMLVISSLANPLFAGQDWEKSLAAAQQTARDNDQLILVEMYADWCGWCKKMAKELFPSETFRDATADMVLLQLDTEDRKEGTRLARELSVTNLPTIYVLTPELAIAGAIQGYLPPDPWVERLGVTMEAFRDFEKRVAEDTGGRTDPDSTFRLALELANRRFWADAEARFFGLVDGENVPLSTRADSMLELSRLFAALERNEESEAMLARLVESEGVDDETIALAYLIKAETRLRARDFQGAFDELKIVERDYPGTDAFANARNLIRIVQARLGSN